MANVFANASKRDRHGDRLHPLTARNIGQHGQPLRQPSQYGAVRVMIAGARARTVVWRMWQIVGDRRGVRGGVGFRGRFVPASVTRAGRGRYHWRGIEGRRWGRDGGAVGRRRRRAGRQLAQAHAGWHEHGQNGKEIPEFDPLIVKVESDIAELRNHAKKDGGK